MPDIYHYIGSDLLTSPTGDILSVDGQTLGQQRILRRLLTNPLDYIWQPEYGAGLGQFIGRPETASQVQGVIQQQVLLESAVAQSPPPIVSVSFDPDGTFFVSIQYTDAATGSPLTLEFNIDN